MAQWGNFEYGSGEYAKRGDIDRATAISGSGSMESTAELTEVFPSQSSTDLDFTLITDPVLGFASDWVYEEGDVEDPTAFTVTLDMIVNDSIDIRVQYDEAGDGSADYTSPKRVIRRDNDTASWSELGDDGYYRLIVSKMRRDDYLRAVTWGPTRY